MAHRRLTLLAVLVGLLALGTTSASASLTPVGGAVTGTATNATWTSNLGFRYTCPRADISGSITSTIQFNASMTFGPSGATQCVVDVFGGIQANWTCRGTATFEATSSVTGVRAAGPMAFDSGFSCRVFNGYNGCTYTMAGPQGPFNDWRFDAPGLLSVSIRGVRVTVSGPGFCGGTETWDFRATYVTFPASRITIS